MFERSRTNRYWTQNVETTQLNSRLALWIWKFIKSQIQRMGTKIIIFWKGRRDSLLIFSNLINGHFIRYLEGQLGEMHIENRKRVKIFLKLSKLKYISNAIQKLSVYSLLLCLF